MTRVFDNFDSCTLDQATREDEDEDVHEDADVLVILAAPGAVSWIRLHDAA